MLFTKSILPLALVAVSQAAAFPADGAPSSNLLEARDTVVTCKPDVNNWNVKDLKVSLDRALEQAKKGGFKKGKSGDPHKYGNGDGIQWGVKGCNKKDAELWEYPIYWESKKGGGGKIQEWLKDESNSKQDITPLRVAYISDKGTHDGRVKLCGVMTHTKIEKDGKTDQKFKKCG